MKRKFTLLFGLLFLLQVSFAQEVIELKDPLWRVFPNMFRFENDTLIQELSFTYAAKNVLNAHVNTLNKRTSSKQSMDGQCEWVKKSKWNKQPTVSDTVFGLTFRSINRKYRMEIQLNELQSFARVLLPPGTKQDGFTPLASVGVLKKQSGGLSWKGDAFYGFLNYLCDRLKLPDSINYIGKVRFAFVVDQQGMLKDVNFLDREIQVNPHYAIVEEMLFRMIMAANQWVPAYIAGEAVNLYVEEELEISKYGVFGPRFRGENPMDKVYPKYDPWDQFYKGDLRDQHKVIQFDYPRESTNTKP